MKKSTRIAPTGNAMGFVPVPTCQRSRAMVICCLGRWERMGLMGRSRMSPIVCYHKARRLHPAYFYAYHAHTPIRANADTPKSCRNRPFSHFRDCRPASNQGRRHVLCARFSASSPC